MKRIPLAAICVVAAFSTIAVPTHAASPIAALKAHIAALRTYQATINLSTVIAPAGGGQGTTLTGVEKIAYAAPNKASIIVSGVMGNLICISDGKNFYRYSDLAKQYSVQPAPASIVGALLPSFDGAKLVAKGTTKTGRDVVNLYVGTIPVRGGVANISMALGAKDNLPRTITLVIPDMPNPRGGAYRITTIEQFVSTVANASLPSSLFVFRIPAGATKSKNLTGMGMPGMGSVPGLP